MEGTQACGLRVPTDPPHHPLVFLLRCRPVLLSPQLYRDTSSLGPPRFSLEALTGPDTELWLIQAPADFAPHCLNGRRVPLTGSQIVKGKLDGKRHRYQVLSSCSPQAGEATLLAPSAEAGGRLTPAPAPQGSLRIIEGPQEYLLSGSSTNHSCKPPPQIPLGLRPRFSAFGGSPPVTGPGSALALSAPTLGKRKKKRQVSEAVAAQDSVNGHGAMEVDTAWGDLEMYSGKKKKKRKKQVNEAEVAEPAAATSEPQDLAVPSTTSCKRKKSKGTETVPPELGVLEAVVETQPPDGAVLPPAKKKKRPKGEGVEATEETTAPSQTQVSVDPWEEAMPPSHKKKRRKEKRQHLMMEPGTEGTEPETGLQEVITEPELPGELGPQAEAVIPPKKKKKEKQWTGLPAPGPEVVEAVLPADLEPEAAPASTQKKEKGKKSAEPRAEVTDAGDSEEPDPEAGAVQRPAKKRRKAQESEVSDTTAQREVSGPQLEHQSGKRSPTERKKKTQKRRSQQEPT